MNKRATTWTKTKRAKKGKKTTKAPGGGQQPRLRKTKVVPKTKKVVIRAGSLQKNSIIQPMTTTSRATSSLRPISTVGWGQSKRPCVITKRYSVMKKCPSIAKRRFRIVKMSGASALMNRLHSSLCNICNSKKCKTKPQQHSVCRVCVRNTSSGNNNKK